MVNSCILILQLRLRIPSLSWNCYVDTRWTSSSVKVTILKLYSYAVGKFKIYRSSVFQVVIVQTLKKSSLFVELYIMFCIYKYLVVLPILKMITSSLLDIECTRFLKYWLSYIFWVQSLTISLQAWTTPWWCWETHQSFSAQWLPFSPHLCGVWWSFQ
jgi:hypothetical protein